MTQPLPDTPMDETTMLALLIEQQTVVLSKALPQVPAEQLSQALAVEFEQQEGLAAVLEDVLDDGKRAANPIWGFRILSPDGKEVGRVMVPKMLDPRSRSFIADLASWGSVQGMVTTPTMRALWRAIGGRVEFFQTKAPSPIIQP